MRRRERLAVHRPGQQHTARADVGHWEAADEDGLAGLGKAETMKHHMGRPIGQARAIEQRVQPGARPSRLPHGGTPPGQPGRRRVEEPAPVAGTLQHEAPGFGRQ